MKKLNGTASWILAIIALAVIVYNTVAVHVIVKNEVKHLQADVVEIKTLLLDHLLEKPE